MKALKTSSSERIFFVDVLKSISIIAVVSYHSIFVPRSTYVESELLLDVLFSPLRFCVPIFITISFFLLELSVYKRQDCRLTSLLTKRLYRLAIPTLAWFSLMIFVKSFTGSAPGEIVYDIAVGEIFTGAYYLLIIFQLLFLFFWTRNWAARRSVLFSLCIFQILFFTLIHFLLSTKDFSNLLVWLRIIKRPLIIYWLIYMVFGIVLSRNLFQLSALSKRIPVAAKLAILIALGGMFVGEYRYLYSLTLGTVPPFEYVMFTCIASVPILFLCFASISEKDFPSIIKPSIYLLSKYSLGIFCINGVLSQVFLSFGSRFLGNMHFSFFEILSIKLLGWLFLLLISLGLSKLIARMNCKALVC